MDIKDLLLFIITGINIMLTGVILFHNPKDKINIYYSLTVLSVALWTFGSVMFRIVHFSSALPWAILYYISASLIATYFLYFAIVFPKRVVKKWSIVRHVLMHIPAIILAYLVLYSPGFISDFRLQSWGKEIKLGSVYYLYILHFIGYMGTAFLILTKKLFIATGIERTQIKVVLAGTFIATIFGAIFNLFLPLSNYKLVWLGPYFTLIMVVAIAYAIIKHQLMNVKVIATELLTFAVWIAILVEVFLAETLRERIMELGLLVFVVVFGILIIRSVLREVETREEIQRLAVSLEGANAKLRKIDEMKSDFIHIASHQLRTPLTAIKGYASLLIEGSYGKVPKKLEQPLERVLISSGRMVQLVGDLLNVSRIERGKIQYEFAKFDVKKLVRELVDEFKVSIVKDEKKKHIKVSFTDAVVDKKEVIMNGDLGKIKEIVSNLIDNAIKYTEEGSVKASISMPEVNRV